MSGNTTKLLAFNYTGNKFHACTEHRPLLQAIYREANLSQKAGRPANHCSTEEFDLPSVLLAFGRLQKPEGSHANSNITPRRTLIH